MYRCVAGWLSDRKDTSLKTMGLEWESFPLQLFDKLPTSLVIVEWNTFIPTSSS